MKTDIEYGRDVIVGATHRGAFHWYASEKEIWILDQVKWSKLFTDAGLSTPTGYEDRFGIGVVTEAMTADFLAHLACDRVDVPHLQALLNECDLADQETFCHLLPSLLVNFDSKKLFSNFPEPTEFERFVPEGWTAAYGVFFELVPPEERYWIINGKNLLAAPHQSLNKKG
jgi:hypothetical protein